VSRIKTQQAGTLRHSFRLLLLSPVGRGRASRRVTKAASSHRLIQLTQLTPSSPGSPPFEGELDPCVRRCNIPGTPCFSVECLGSCAYIAWVTW
jgi:hypothetical protein